MRMRFKPYAHDELMAADFHVHEPLIWGGKWHAQYARPEQPFVLELGCGKGGFLSQLACAHPENNYLGIDITDKVLILAKRKIEAAYTEAGRPIDNVKIMSTDIERIKGVLTAEDTVSRVYINFCNPWSKNASSNKHRLTYPRQLIQYREFLKDGGEIYFKTDDDDLFRDSLEYFPASGYEITWKTFDLHENEPEWNIRTEHEGMFTEMGIKIKALIAKKLPGDAAVTWIEPKVLKKMKAWKGSKMSFLSTPWSTFSLQVLKKDLILCNTWRVIPPPQRRSKMSFFVNTMVCGFSLYQILAFFLIYSCLGWCLEVIYAAVSTGQLVNRGFLNGPVCPIYGFGMIIVLFTLSPLADNLLLLYLGGVILPSVLELAGGWALYKLYHTRWWDYSDFPFNIGGYICLEFSLLWGVGTVVVMKAVHPVIAGFVEMVPRWWALSSCASCTPAMPPMWW